MEKQRIEVNIMKVTKEQFDKLTEIERKARAQFQKFHAGQIDMDSFQLSLKGLAVESHQVYENPFFDDFLSMIDEQFEEYKSGDAGYLLNPFSSGSLVNQFEVYDEIEITEEA